MSKIPQTRIPLNVIIDQFKWRLTREDDMTSHIGRTVHWVEWDDPGYYKSHYSEPAVGRTCVLDIHPTYATWHTTEVVEILEQTDARIKFRTTHSTYVLEKINSADS